MLTKMETFAVPEELKDMCVASWGWQGASHNAALSCPRGFITTCLPTFPILQPLDLHLISDLSKKVSHKRPRKLGSCPTIPTLFRSTCRNDQNTPFWGFQLLSSRRRRHHRSDHMHRPLLQQPCLLGRCQLPLDVESIHHPSLAFLCRLAHVKSVQNTIRRPPENEGATYPHTIPSPFEKSQKYLHLVFDELWPSRF